MPEMRRRNGGERKMGFAEGRKVNVGQMAKTL